MDEIGPAYENGSQKARQEMKALTAQFKDAAHERDAAKKQVVN